MSTGRGARAAHFQRLTAALRQPDDGGRLRALFAVLWGLPAALQLGLPIAMIREALPSFLPTGYFDHVPGLLGRIEQLAASPDAKSRLDPALFPARSCAPLPWGEAALCFGIGYLQSAANARWCPETLTSGCVASTDRVITARETLAFRRNDPEGAREFEAFIDRGRARLPLDPEQMPSRTTDTDPASLLERAASWQRAFAWLAKSDVAGQPDIGDPERLDAALERWGREGGALTPR